MDPYGKLGGKREGVAISKVGTWGLGEREDAYNIAELVSGGVRLHTWSSHCTRPLSSHQVRLQGCLSRELGLHRELGDVGWGEAGLYLVRPQLSISFPAFLPLPPSSSARVCSLQMEKSKKGVPSALVQKQNTKAMV